MAPQQTHRGGAGHKRPAGRDFGNGGGGGDFKGKKPRLDNNSKPSNGGKPYSKPDGARSQSSKPTRRGGVANRDRAQSKNGNGARPPTTKPSEDAPRRKAPITGRATAPAADDSDEEMGDGDEQDADVEMEDAGNGNATGRSYGTGANATADPAKRLTKAEKLALHAAQPHRTSLLPSHPLLQDTLLPLWEQARRADISKEERKKAIAGLWEAVKGRVREVARGHKGGRVLQTIVKYGGKEERNGLAKELEGTYRAMMESKYSKFLMSKLIRYCPTVRPQIIAEIGPAVPQLLFHSHACSPLADFFELYASPKEKRMLVRGFYPKEVLLFDGLGVGKDGKDGIEAGKTAEGLEKVLAGMKDGKAQERVLEELNEKIVHVFNNTQKEAVAQAIFHRVVLEYLTCVYAYLEEEDADKKMHALLDASLETLADICHTKDGASLVREFIARGSAKDRKSILRVLKPHLQEVAEDAEAQNVLFAAFDYVDDTKMMAKAIISEVGVLAPELAMHKVGRRALLYLLVPRNTRYFIPATVQQLKLTDASSSKTSKKATDVRQQELKAAICPDLLKLVDDKGEDLLRDAGASLLLIEIMLEASGDKTKAFEALLQPLKTPYDPSVLDAELNPETSHVLDLGPTGRAYKALLAGGRFSTKEGQVAGKLDEATRLQFAKDFWAAITSEEAGGPENAVRVATGNAPFTVVELVDALKEDPASLKEVKSVLCTPSALEQVEKSWRKGANVLAEKLKSL